MGGRNAGHDHAVRITGEIFARVSCCAEFVTYAAERRLEVQFPQILRGRALVAFEAKVQVSHRLVTRPRTAGPVFGDDVARFGKLTIAQHGDYRSEERRVG